MIIIIIILSLIIIGLTTYLFLLNRELKSLPIKIDKLKENDSNNLIYTSYNLKNINPIIIKINKLIKEIKIIKFDYIQKNKALMKMATNISHDLRTPLTSALGYMDIVLKSDLTEEEKMLELKTIQERLIRLEELINSFFEFSKVIGDNKEVQIRKSKFKCYLGKLYSKLL